MAIKSLNSKPTDLPVAEVLPRNSLDFYKEWLVNQCAVEDTIPDKTIEDFLLCFPDSLRDITFLKITTKIHFFLFETSIIELNKELK